QGKELIDLWHQLKLDKSPEKLENLGIQTRQYDNRLLLKKQMSPGLIKKGEGSFIVLLSEGEQLGREQLQTLENLSTAAAFWISREDAIVQTEIRLRNEFVWKLVKTPNFEHDKHTYLQAKLFGYNLDLPYICIAGYSENIDSIFEE